MYNCSGGVTKKKCRKKRKRKDGSCSSSVRRERTSTGNKNIIGELKKQNNFVKNYSIAPNIDFALSILR